MKVRNLAILAAVGGVVLAGSAQANIIDWDGGVTGGMDLETTIVDMSGGFSFADGSIDAASAAAVGAAWTAANVTTYRVWAHVDSALGTVAFVGGSADNALNLIMNSSNGAFFNAGPPFGGDTAPNEGFLGFDPSIAYDSFVTLGGATAGTMPGGFSIQDGGGVLGGLAGNVSGQNVGWFITPSAGAGVVSDGNGGWRVLVAQLTVAAGAQVDGWMRVAGGPDDVYYHFEVPAPGALALLGLAGLAGTRRRRA